jgi:hypothetical protein
LIFYREKHDMSFFDEYDILGGLGDLISDGFDAIVENPGTSLLVVAGAAATAGTAFVAAPLIGATASALGMGVAGGTLSGAAASSAGLAALGGGSLAAGGAGMAGGTAVVTAVGGVAGATAAGTAASIAKSDKGQS